MLIKLRQCILILIELKRAHIIKHIWTYQLCFKLLIEEQERTLASIDENVEVKCASYLRSQLSEIEWQCHSSSKFASFHFSIR